MNIDNNQSNTTNEQHYEGDDYLEQGDYYNETGGGLEGDINTPLGTFSKKSVALLAGVILVVAVLVVLVINLSGNDSDSPKSSAESIVNEVDSEIANGTNTLDDDTPIYGTTFTPDEKAKLRAAGYTGDEIENAQINSKSIEEMLQTADDEKKKHLQELYKELSPEVTDETSQAYKDLVDMTWLSGDLRPVARGNSMFSTKTIRENCRYVKLPPKGGNLMLKVTLRNGDSIFYSVHPEQYENLDQEGNIVIDYDQINYGSYMYYLNVKEVPINN